MVGVNKKVEKKIKKKMTSEEVERSLKSDIEQINNAMLEINKLVEKRDHLRKQRDNLFYI
jgi:hypothetical protein